MTPGVISPNPDVFTAIWDQQWGISVPQIITSRLYDEMSVPKATILHRIRHLSFIRSKVQSIRELDNDTLQRFTSNVLLVERQINVIVNWPGASGNAGPLPIRCMPFYSSSLLFVYLVFREVPITSSILDNFVTRLRTALVILKPERVWQEFSPVFLLWVLFIGGWAAEGRLDRHWYSIHVAWLSAQMELESWDQARSILTEYCFVDFICENPCRKLWDDARQLEFRT